MQLLTHLSDAPESIGPLKQLSRLAQEWDVKTPDIFMNRKVLQHLCTDRGIEVFGPDQRGHVTGRDNC